jgi:hypothetical protein
MIKRILCLGLLAFALAGCVTTQNPLSRQDVESFRLASVHVDIDSAATLWWGDGDRAYARSKGRSEADSEELSKTPEAHAFTAQLASAKIGAALEQQLKPVLTGPRPVKVNVHLRRLYVASAIQRVIVGGSHEMTADVTVTDARTGALLVSHPGFHAIALAGQGIGGAMLDAALMADPIDRLTLNFASKYREWLLPQAVP